MTAARRATAAADPLLRALDAVDGPVDFFVRDDDAGWDDARLFALLDTLARCEVAADLAVIPQALTGSLAERLLQRRRVQPIGLHQHGWSHANHEPEGRKCEFGATRPASVQADDVARGAHRLETLLGAAFERIFTPPWNRCDGALPGALRRLGFVALSRESGAAVRQPQAALGELPVHADWCRHWRAAVDGGEDAATRIAGDLARRVRPGARIGLMLHHAAMADDQRALLGTLLRRWAAHPHARWQPMHALLNPSPT